MNLDVRQIEIIISALKEYLSVILDKEDFEVWSEVAVLILELINKFSKLRKEKLHE